MWILRALYFFLPAYLANMAPVFVAAIFNKKFSLPIDGYRTFRDRRIFGDHKTWRGLVFGTAVGGLTIILQRSLHSVSFFSGLEMIEYGTNAVVWMGLLMGFGALVGDCVKSFFKRQMDIAPGKAWPGFDQLDFVVGGLVAGSIIFLPSWQTIITLIIITPLLHWLTNIIGYKLKLKKYPW